MGSFNDEYLKLRKKRLKDEKNGKTNESLTPYRRPLASDEPKAVINEDGLGGDIAPVTWSELKAARDKKLNKTVVDTTEEKEPEERSWFKKSGIWDDGYQFGDVSKTILAGGQDLWKNAVEGAAKIGEGTVDALLTIAPYVAQGQYYANGGGFNIQADQAFNQTIDLAKKENAEIIKKDIVDEEAVAKFLVEDHHPLAYKHLTGRDLDEDSVFGEKSDALAQSGGQLAATAGLQALGVPWWLTTGATSLGGESENALNQGATLEEAAISGMISAGAEILTEKISGGISFGGKTLDDALTQELARGISNKTLRTLAKLGIDAAGEGGEEILSGVMGAIGQKLTYADDKEISELFSSEEAFESFIGGVVLGGGSSAISAGKAVISGEDAVTGLKTDTEQKIVDKLYKDELANAEKDGKKLTLKDKQKLYDGVLNNLEKGYISTDVIEEVLGGEDYKTYQNELKRQQDLDNELNELRNMKSSDMTDIQSERMAELKAMKPNTEMVNALKFGIDEKIRNGIKGTKLAESYNEKARRGEAFKADLSGYDSKQAAVVQKAIDSGILNNTNRTHEFVDMVSKISADKGVLFDFSNNEKLKESGFALEGKTINGFVTKDGVTLNIDSQKSLNSVVGHEIAHVLEGTELYTELSKAITEYAKGKGDYQGRYDSLSALYKGIEGANIDAELTADLVGDYLFTDADFVNNLSTEHRNVFEKIFDEIKYLWNVATAGSKEARELEKVKKVFEEAYKASGKAQAGTKYSMSDNTGKTLTKEQNDYFKDSKMRDDNGNLKVMYHGSQDAGFHVFDPSMSDDGTSLFFVDRNDVAASYSGTSETYEAQTIKTAEDMNKFIESIGAEGYEVAENNGKFTLLYEGERVADSNTAKGIYEEFCWYEGVGEGDANYKVYLNLTNPLEIDAKGRPWNKIDAEFSQEIYDKYNSLTPEEKAALTDLAEWEDFRLFNSEVQEARGDAVASAYAKMGEDCNIYDLFSVAADNFSEEAMRENARGYLKTRDYAQRAKEGGYDGVIFKNIHDNGGYSNGSEGASTVAIAFNSEQVKSVANEKPTADKDIRYSLSDKKIINKLTGEEIDGNTYSVLERLNKGETVSSDEIANLKEIQEGDKKASELQKSFIAEHPEFANVDTKNVGTYLLTDDKRTNLRNEIISQRLQEGSFTGIDKNGNEVYNGSVKQDKRLDIVIGLPASGKSSSIVNPLSQYYQSVVIDSDIIKRMLPEFNDGWGGMLVHEESSLINAQLLEQSMNWGNNIVLPIVGSKVKSVERYIAIANKMGYSVNVHLNELSNGKAVGRMIKRYFDSGRFINPTFVADYGNGPTEVYEQIKQRGDISGYSRWNNDVAKGQRPILVDVSEGNRLYASYSDAWGSGGSQISGRLAGSSEQTAKQNNEIAPIKEASSSDGVFFDGKNPKFSLSEYTAEEKKAHNDAVVKHFGRTYKWAETGYLLLDGTKLDLSGKHDGAPGGYRTVDHRDITEALGYDYGGGEYSDSLIQFMSEGNIRIIPEIDGINLSVKPTKAQEQALTEYIFRNRGAVVLDIDDLKGYTVVSVEYPSGTRSAKILNDIREWFENGIKPENSSGYSLTKEGDTPKRYGSYNVYGKDIGLDRGNIAPMREDISDVENTTEGIPPVVDKTVDESIPDGFAPMEHSAMYESEVKDNQAQMDRLAEEASRLYSEGKVDEAQAIIEQMQALNESGRNARDRYNALRTQERADTEGYLNSLTDADAPPEMEAPYFEDGGIIDPFDERDVKTVGDRKVKSFMAENPEVKPYFQAEANILLGELNNSIKGERFYTATPDGHLDKDGGMTYGSDSYGVWSGTSRSVTPDIEQLLDNAKGDGKGYSYDEIRTGLEAIIKGDANNACSKRIEFVINDRLMNGYITDGGVEVPANQEYRDLIKSQGVLEGREEAFKQLIKDTNKVERAQMEDIAPLPTFDTASEKQIPGQQTIFEDAKTVEAPIKEAPIKNTAAESTGEEPKIAKVLTEEPKTDKKRGNAWSMFKNNVLDKGMVFETLSLKTGNRELQARWNSIRYAKSKAQQLIGKGDGNVKALTSIEEKVEKSGKTQEFSNYLYHLHNVDRMSLEGKAQARIKELESKFGPLMPEQVVAISLKEITDKTTERTANTIREAKEYLNALETKNKPVFGDEVTADMSKATAAKLERTNPEFKQWAQEVYDYTNNLREMLVEEGVISRETADLWAEIYPHYVPIRRAGKDGPAINVALDTNRTGINAPIKRATGGNSDILPLFDTMALRTEQTYRAIAKNRFGVELKNTLGTTIDRGDMSLDDAIDNLDNDEGLLKEGKNGANPTFTVFENGKRVEFEITEEMYDAIKPTGKGLSYTNKVANTVGNVFRGLLTEYNPVFMVTNGIKDAQDVLINSQHAGKTYANIPVAIKEMATKGHWYKEYIANGGEQNTYFDDDSQTFKETDKGIKKIVGMPLRAISAVNNTIERLPRLAEYIASRKSGASVDVSMLDAARVTTNFAAGGDLTKALNRNGFTFLNASTQGAIQQVRNVREAKANGLKGWLQLAGKTAIAGIPALILNDLLWDDDEEYEELSDYIKQNYYVVAKFGDGKFVRIPKGRTVAVIQDAFEQINNARTGDDEVDMQSFFELAIGNLAPNNPLENNIVAPIMQVANNKTWYGEDLVPSRLQDLPDAEQYDESTDSISKWLGEKLDISPYKINYLLNQYSGGIGDVALPMLTPESDGSGVLAPFADKFTTDSTMKNQNVSDFYETVDNLTKNANSANATDEDILKNKYMGTIRTELGELYAEKREIQNSNLSDAEKNAAVREIQEQINAKAKESLDTYGKVNIDGKYATVGDIHYRWYEPSEDSDAEPGWEKITDQQLEKQKKVTSGLGITPSEYWSDNKEYDFAYEYPEKYKFLNENGVTYDDYANGDEKFKEAWTWASKNPGKYTMSKVFSDDLLTFYGYRSEANDIKGVDEDGDGRTDSGTKKTNVINWLNGRNDLDYGQKIILYRSMYNSKQDREDYNMDIIDYLNSRNDISYAQMKTILEELGMKVDSEGYITWD